jgi:3-oxoacyl-[acyl-carrier-protein] synthase-3
MLFQHVSIDTIAHVDGPVRLTSAELVGRLQPALRRLGIPVGALLEEVAGIRARRIWDPATRVSDAATMAGRMALAASAVPADRISVLINTSVCRDYLEPSTAAVVHGALGLPGGCANFDVGNACLAFLTGMELAGRMIEQGDVEYALIVDGESSGEITERTVERLNSPDATAEQFRREFASLTLGSGAAAMVLGRSALLPYGHRFRGGVSLAATAYSDLCRGTMDRMVTDGGALLDEGLKLAARTYRMAGEVLGWVAPDRGWGAKAGGGPIDEFAVHQVSKVYTDALVDVLGMDPAKVLALYPEYGNIGPASVPVVLSKLDELGRLRPGTRVALMGIGSGLNCSMAEVVW